MKKETKGALLAILAAIISGVSIPANKLFIVDLDATVFTAVRAIIIGTIFFFIASYDSRFNYKKFRHVPWRYLIAIGAIGGAFAFLLYFTGLQLAQASTAAFLRGGTLPLCTAIIAFVFLKEKITPKTACVMLLMFAGVIMLYFSQVPQSQLWSNPQLGDLLIIAAVILWAVEYVISKKAMLLGETNLVVSFARMFFGSLILFGFVILFGKLYLIMTLSLQQWVNIMISTALLFAYVFFWYWSIKNINVSKVAMLFLLAPVISLIASILIFNEQPQTLQLAGAAVILVGAYLLTGVKSESRKSA